jgi:MFS transporter, DHA3 family, macrolide efflux protein
VHGSVWWSLLCSERHCLTENVIKEITKQNLPSITGISTEYKQNTGVKNLPSSKQRHVLLTHHNYRNLFLGRFISAVGDKVFTIALAVWIISSGHQDAKFHLGLLLAMNAIPIVLFGPLAGTLADKFDRKICMLIADASRFSILLITLLLLLNNQLGTTQMYFICFALATFIPLFESAANASIAALVVKEDLSKAIATDSSIISMSQVIGASLGGILVATIHFEGALIFNMITFLASFFFVNKIDKALIPDNQKVGYIEEIIKGFHYVFKNIPLRTLLMIFGFVNFFTASIFILIPFIVKYHFNLPIAQWIGIYEVSFAIGAGAMAVALSFVKSHQYIYQKMAISLGVFGLSFIATGLTPSPWSVTIFLLFAGAGLSIINTLALGIFQYSVADEMKGRFFAILGSVALSVIPISYILTGYISAFISAEMLFVIYGSMIALIALIMAVIPRIQNEIGTK